MLPCTSVHCSSSGPTHRFMWEAKPPTFLLMSAGGVLPTHCVLEHSETQSGGRKDLGVEGGRGGRFLMSQLGRVIKVGLFGAELIGSYSVWQLIGDTQQNGNNLSRADLRQRGKSTKWKEEKQVCHTCSHKLCFLSAHNVISTGQHRPLHKMLLCHTYLSLCFDLTQRVCCVAAPWHVWACAFWLCSCTVCYPLEILWNVLAIGALNCCWSLFKIVSLFSSSVTKQKAPVCVFHTWTHNSSRGCAAAQQLLTYCAGHVC